MSCSPGAGIMSVALTAVTFLTLRAVMLRSPPCLASIAASFIRLNRMCQPIKPHRNSQRVRQLGSIRLHEQHVIQVHLGQASVDAQAIGRRVGGMGTMTSAFLLTLQFE